MSFLSPTVSRGPVPDPAQVHTATELASALAVLRADRSYAALDRAVRPERLPRSTIGGLLTTGRCTAETLELFLRACEVPRGQWVNWRAARERTLTASPLGLDGAIRVAQADPRRLGVHAAINALGATGDLPAYVERDTDTNPHGVRALIRQAAQRGGMVVLVGSSSVGKTRCAFEALQVVVPAWWLLHPTGPEQVRQAAATAPTRLVVWLDELQNYLGGPDKLDAGTMRALLGAGAIVVATIWPERYATYTALPFPGQGTDLYVGERELLGLADVVRLSDRFSIREHDRARAAADAGDWRIALALKSGDYGLTQVIAAAPQLVHCWEAADPYAAAVLNAAIDATRLGVTSPLSTEFLRLAAPGYCDARQRATAPSNWFEAALAYATQTLRGAAAALAPVAAPGAMGQIEGYQVADYLQQHAAAKRHRISIPATCWQALADHLMDRGDQERVGRAARDRLLYRYAEPLLQKAADANVFEAANILADLLVEQGRNEELRTRAEAGDTPAAWRLADILAMDGHDDEALQFLRAHVDAGGAHVAWRLANVLVKQGHDDEALQFLRTQFDAGDLYVAWKLADMLVEQGKPDEALKVLHAQSDVDDLYAGIRLANLLVEEGHHDELRARAEAGSSYAIGRLINLLNEQGHHDEAMAFLLAQADAGDSLASWRLADLLAEHGRHDELRAWAEAGNASAAGRLADLLAEQGRHDEALAFLRAQYDAGNVPVVWSLADLLVGQGQRNEALKLLRTQYDIGDASIAWKLVDVLTENGQGDEALTILHEQVNAGETYAASRLIDFLGKQGDHDEASRLRCFGITLEE
ncbi:tetratricopeptide repeat protein [Streptosporangium sp. NPDC006007]|uniref:tetratricopeptide repeat protein n=1 Tax=Streptosporangium sp. NPDC006007 TaxID=3154575 RepID=UPI0033BB98C9